MKRISVGLLLAILCTGSAFAVQAKGFGLSPCGEYLAERSANAAFLPSYVSWTHGYMSGYNAGTTTGIEIKEIPDSPTIYAYMDKHCRENPLDVFANGVQQMMHDLVKKQRR